MREQVVDRVFCELIGEEVDVVMGRCELAVFGCDSRGDCKYNKKKKEGTS